MNCKPFPTVFRCVPYEAFVCWANARSAGLRPLLPPKHPAWEQHWLAAGLELRMDLNSLGIPCPDIPLYLKH